MAQISLSAPDGTTTPVDDIDFERFGKWSWYLQADGYVVRSVYLGGGRSAAKRRLLYLHRLILGLEHGDPRQGDHEDLDKLNNRRSNLRIAERAHLDNKQNQGLLTTNTSGYRGVTWDKQRQRWKAQAMLDRKHLSLGFFDTPEDADAAVKAWRAVHMPFSKDAKAIRPTS
jgi:hypothetical protein